MSITAPAIAWLRMTEQSYTSSTDQILWLDMWCCIHLRAPQKTVAHQLLKAVGWEKTEWNHFFLQPRKHLILRFTLTELMWYLFFGKLHCQCLFSYPHIHVEKQTLFVSASFNFILFICVFIHSLQESYVKRCPIGLPGVPRRKKMVTASVVAK